MSDVPWVLWYHHFKSIIILKVQRDEGNSEMPQKLRVFPALAENLDSSPCTHVVQHGDSLNSFSETSTFGYFVYLHVHTVHVDKQAHTNIHE